MSHGVRRQTLSLVAVQELLTAELAESAEKGNLESACSAAAAVKVLAGEWQRTSEASEPRERSAPTKRRARERVGESEGRSPSEKNDATGD